LRGNGEVEPSAVTRERVLRARNVQLKRYAGEKRCTPRLRCRRGYCEKCAKFPPRAEKLLETAILRLNLSARAHDRILKVARTIADLDDSPGIVPRHLSEAIQYHTLDRTCWA
jgi:magnesium chelatase family protein